MRSFLRGCAAGLLSLLLTTTAAWAQSTAQLSGRVTDESGAVLPGATVTATQTATGFVRSDVTDANGAYVLSNLPLGPYRFEVSLSGFRTYVQTGIVLQVGASPILNAKLSVGQLEESVTVEGAAPLVDERRGALHGDRLFKLAHRELGVEDRRGPHLQHDAGLYVGAESRQRDFEPVRTQRQVRQNVGPVRIGDVAAHEASGGLRGGDGRT